jgi:hypothetical protein
VAINSYVGAQAQIRQFAVGVPVKMPGPVMGLVPDAHRVVIQNQLLMVDFNGQTISSTVVWPKNNASSDADLPTSFVPFQLRKNCVPSTLLTA